MSPQVSAENLGRGARMTISFGQNMKVMEIIKDKAKIYSGSHVLQFRKFCQAAYSVICLHCAGTHTPPLPPFKKYRYFY